eukprot:8085004-Ditylum_brightwellii.AAC.1
MGARDFCNNVPNYTFKAQKRNRIILGYPGSIVLSSQDLNIYYPNLAEFQLDVLKNNPLTKSALNHICITGQHLKMI